MAAQFNGLPNSATQSPATSSTLPQNFQTNESEEVGQFSKAIKLHVGSSPSQNADSVDVVPIAQTAMQPENAGGVQLDTGVGGVVGGNSSAFIPFSKLNERRPIPCMNSLRGQQMMRSAMVNGNASSAGSSKFNPMMPMDSTSDKSPQVDEEDASRAIIDINAVPENPFSRAAPRTHGFLRAVNVIRTGTMYSGPPARSTVAMERETTQIVVEQVVEQVEQAKADPEYLVLFPLEAPLFPVHPEQLGWRSMIDKQERRRPPSITARRFKAFSRYRGREVLANGDVVDLELRLG